MKNEPNIIPLEIFKNYDESSWNDWIDDILYLGIAYPVSRLTIDGDPLIDVFDYLRVNNVSSKLYTNALISTFSSHIGYYEYPDKIERILDAFIIGKIPKTKDLLINLINDRKTDTLLLPSGITLKSKILQVLLNLPLTKEEQSMISFDFLRVLNRSDLLVSDISFIGNFLNFHRLTGSTNHKYFSIFLILLNKIEKVLYTNDQLLNLCATISWELIEYQEKSVHFYYSFYKFIKNNYKDIFMLNIFRTLMTNIMSDENSIFSLAVIHESIDSSQIIFGEAVSFLLNFILPGERRLLEVSVQEWHDIIAFFIDNNDYGLVKSALLLKKEFIGNNFDIHKQTNTLMAWNQSVFINNIYISELIECVMLSNNPEIYIRSIDACLGEWIH